MAYWADSESLSPIELISLTNLFVMPCSYYVEKVRGRNHAQSEYAI